MPTESVLLSSLGVIATLGLMSNGSVFLSGLGVILMLKAICCSGATLEEGKNLVFVIIKKSIY